MSRFNAFSILIKHGGCDEPTCVICQGCTIHKLAEHLNSIGFHVQTVADYDNPSLSYIEVAEDEKRASLLLARTDTERAFPA